MTGNPLHEIILCILQVDFVQLKRDQHRMCPDTFIAVNESMIFNQTVSEALRTEHCNRHLNTCELYTCKNKC